MLSIPITFNSDKGKFNAVSGQTCFECPSGFFQDQSTIPSLSCKACPTGYNSTLSGSSSCSDLGFVKPSDCKNDEFFNTTLRECVRCPSGASCLGPITWSQVKAKFGWQQCPNNHSKFEPCINPDACLGGPNKDLARNIQGEGDSNKTDPAQCPDCNEPGAVLNSCSDCTAQCDVAYVNNSRLCSQCATGWMPVTSGRGRCQKCTAGSGESSAFILVLIVFVLIIMFVVLVALKMRSSGRRKAAHSTLKRTVFTHIQMVSIIMSLNVPWPETVRVILVGISSVMSVSGHTEPLHCGTSLKSVADVFFPALLISAVLPVCVVVVSSVFWFQCVPRCPVLGCAKGIRMAKCCALQKNPFDRNIVADTNGTEGAADATAGAADAAGAAGAAADSTAPWKSTRDGWIATNVYFVYIIFPSIVRMSFETFQCQEICGESFLVMDPKERCGGTGSRQMLFGVGVALPALLLYIGIIPSLMLVYLWLHRKVMLTDRKLVLRFGLLFSGYTSSRWYWEIFVIMRKVVLIMIVTFGQSNKSQLHFALGALIVLLYLQERGQPFGGFEHNHDSISSGERSSSSSLQDGVLAEGWEETKDEEGTTYYYNQQSGATQWELPVPASGSLVPAQLPPTTVVESESSPVVDRNKEQSQNRLLHLMEVASLLVLLTMVWVSVFFTLTTCDKGDVDCIVLSLIVFASNLAFVVVCTYVGCKEFGERNHIGKKVSQLQRSVQMVSMRLRRTNTDTDQDTEIELGDGETKVSINPLHVEKNTTQNL